MRSTRTSVPSSRSGLTLWSGWVVWRTGHRLGDAVSGHGPDADRIADGERDWTVPLATLLFAGGYAVLGALLTLAGDARTAPDGSRAVLVALTLAVLVGGPAIATGSGPHAGAHGHRRGDLRGSRPSRLPLRSRLWASPATRGTPRSLHDKADAVP